MSTKESLGVGSDLAGYRLEEEIGHGGMGVVYRAHDDALDRSVAVKVVSPRLASDTPFRDRLLVESRLAASLDHANVVPVYDAGEIDGRLYLAMRYVEGSDLRTLLKKDGKLAPERAVAITAQVAAALDAAHAKGLVHRDVKPSNVLLDQHGHAYLADFGLTRRLTDQAPGFDSDLSVGTPAYAAPEQIEGKEVDGRADQYSLACLLYECLTGGPPFRKQSKTATLFAHLEEEPPGVPGLEQVFARGLAKDPEGRYPTCTDLVGAARDALGLEQTPRLLRPRWLLAFAAALLLVTAAAVIGGVLAFGSDSAPKPDLTVRANSVVRIDPDTNEVTAVVGVGRKPTAVAVSGDTIWVLNAEDRTVSAIDASSNTVVETKALRGALPWGDFQDSFALGADEGGAWAVTGTGVDQGLLTRLRRGQTRPTEFLLDYEPRAISVADGRVIVNAVRNGHGVALLAEPETGDVEEIARFDRTPTGYAIVGEGVVWAVTSSHIARIDPESGRVTGKVPAQDHPNLHASHGGLWIDELSQISLIDPATLQRLRTVRLPSESFWLVPGDDAMWRVAHRDGELWRMNPQSGEVEERIAISEPIPPNPLPSGKPRLANVAVGADGVWVTVNDSFVG